MSHRVLIYAQHILGIGHLVRASRIARAMISTGLDVVVVLGGMPVDGVDWGAARLEYLPPIRAGSQGYADLVDGDGNPVDDDLRQRRRAALMRVIEAERPDALLIEAFPFGRRAMRFELIPALEMVRAWDRPPVVASSLRDILHENRKPHLNVETADLVERLFDLVLVHGDRDLIPLEASFPETNRIAAKVRYTGLVAPAATDRLDGEPFDVVVSAGGGAVGAALLTAAMDTIDRCAAADARWCFITGPNLDCETRDRLMASTSANVTVERFRSDFVALLHHARISISQAGYNTAADLLVARCPSIVVPMAYQGETEQVRRAELLAQRGLVEAIPEDGLSPETLGAAIDRLWEAKMEVAGALPDLDGAEATARLVLAACEAR